MAQVNANCTIETSAPLFGLVDKDGNPAESFRTENISEETVDLVVMNSEHAAATVYVIDRCLVPQKGRARCDFGLRSGDSSYLVEVKHKSRSYQDEVIEQISSTIEHYSHLIEPIINAKKRYCVLVNNRPVITAASTRNMQSKLADSLPGFLLLTTRTLNLANPTQVRLRS